MDTRLQFKKRWGRGRNNNNITDARQLLRLRHAIQHRQNHVSPMNANSFQQKSRTIQKRNFVPQRNKFRKNNRGFVANTQSSRGRLTNRSFVNRNNFVNKRTTGYSMQNRGFRQQNMSRRMDGRNKRVYSNRGGLTITTQNRNVITNDDDLENMTLDDIPGLRGANLPRGLATNSLSLLSMPASVSHFSRVPPVDTMIADGFSRNHEGSAKLMVTDLLPSVSQEDIVELFQNIGPLTRVEELKPGKVIIQFESAEHAEAAVQAYDGILLDGQAMKCHLIRSYDGGHSSLASRLGENPSVNSPRIQIPQQSSSMMFPMASSSRSFHHTPKESVRFTVKLP